MKINVKVWSELSESEKRKLLKRAEEDIAAVESHAQEIIDSIKKNGDSAVKALTKKFDNADIDSLPLRVTEKEIEKADEILSPGMKKALTKAIENVRSFHATQKPVGMHMCETTSGLIVGEKASAIPSAGLYVPRGKGSFPSMLYMMAVPAKIAGVPRICITSPPNPDGTIDPACIYASELCGVNEMYRIGGAQAIAALAFGTETIEPVAKIVGPGNPFVSASKRLLQGIVDTGLPAGPTESIIIADESADPWKVSLDLLIEAEHGPDSSAILITPSPALAGEVSELIPRLADDLPEPRRKYVHEVFSGYGGILLTGTMEEAIEVVNTFAPEHVQIQTDDAMAIAGKIVNAAEILIGEHTPFSLANYAAGANAVLPTGGKAKTYSPVSVRDFMKYTSMVLSSESALDRLKDTVVTLADYEGFPAHANALRHRKQK